MDFEVDTYSEFIETKQHRIIDQALWFKKPTKYALEKEFRTVFYPIQAKNREAALSNHNIRFSVAESYMLLPVNFLGCISKDPILL